MAALEQELAPSEKSGWSQDELIEEFYKLSEVVRDAGSRRAEIGAVLAAIAAQHKETQKTVHLTSTGGKRVKVQFGSQTEYVTEELLEVSRMLGGELFDTLFKSSIEFTERKQNLNMFFNTVHPDEAIQTAKQMIKDAKVTKDKQPYVSVEN